MKKLLTVHGNEKEDLLKDRLSSEQLSILNEQFHSFSVEIIRSSFWTNYHPWFVKRRRVADNFCVFVAEGSLLVELDSEKRILKRGECLLLPENTPHAFGLPDKMKKVKHAIIHCHAYSSFGTNLFEQFKSPFYKLKNPDFFLESLKDSVCLGSNFRDSGNMHAALMLQLLLCELSINGFIEKAECKCFDPRIKKALRFIHENFPANIGVEDIAASCRLKQAQFRKIFKTALNCSPMEYLAEQRLRAARKALSSRDATIKEIAGTCGFNSQYYFCAAFKKRFKCTPGEYRERLLSFQY